MNALEALEAQDEQDTSDTGEDTGTEVEEDTSETVGQETGAAEDTSEENDDEANEDGEDAEGDNSEGTEATEDENKSNNNKELSDEEFEELAKKRGYTKAPSEEEKAKAREAIENDRLKMVDSVKKEMVNVAMDAAEKLIGSKNGEELDRKAIQDFVKEADSHEE